jgi:carbon-monoxide dehydrogenase small subunit
LELLSFVVNGDPVELPVEPAETLLDVLRRRLLLTGAKKGCAEGECGACTVLLDGQPVNSCLLPAMKVRGRTVTTIEGLGRVGALPATGRLHPVQQAFIDAGAVQCGFCTPGVILSAKALIDEGAVPTDDEIKQALSGHICRCTGYGGFVDAVRQACASRH